MQTYSCAICYHHGINTYFSNCYHTICHKCIIKIYKLDNIYITNYLAMELSCPFCKDIGNPRFIENYKCYNCNINNFSYNDLLVEKGICKKCYKILPLTDQYKKFYFLSDDKQIGELITKKHINKNITKNISKKYFYYIITILKNIGLIGFVIVSYIIFGLLKIVSYAFILDDDDNYDNNSFIYTNYPSNEFIKTANNIVINMYYTYIYHNIPTKKTRQTIRFLRKYDYNSIDKLNDLQWN